LSRTDETSTAISDAVLPRQAPQDAFENLRLKWLIPAILLLLAAGLGLQAWEQRQTDDLAALARLQGEARGIAAALAVRTDAAIETLGFASQADIAPSQIAARSAQIDAVFRLSQAQQSPAGSRLALAEETALDLISAGHRLGLSAAGDLVILDPASGARPLLALINAPGALPQPASRARIDLIGPDTAFGHGAPVRPRPRRAGLRAGSAQRPVGLHHHPATADQPQRHRPAADRDPAGCGSGLDDFWPHAKALESPDPDPCPADTQ
jgi:hypothetical protein